MDYNLFPEGNTVMTYFGGGRKCTVWTSFMDSFTDIW